MIKKVCDVCEKDVPQFPAFRLEELGINPVRIVDLCSARCVREWAAGRVES